MDSLKSIFPFSDAISSRAQRWAVGFQQVTAAGEGGQVAPQKPCSRRLTAPGICKPPLAPHAPTGWVIAFVVCSQVEKRFSLSGRGYPGLYVFRLQWSGCQVYKLHTFHPDKPWNGVIVCNHECVFLSHAASGNWCLLPRILNTYLLS